MDNILYRYIVCALLICTTILCACSMHAADDQYDHNGECLSRLMYLADQLDRLVDVSTIAFSSHPGELLEKLIKPAESSDNCAWCRAQTVIEDELASLKKQFAKRAAISNGVNDLIFVKNEEILRRNKEIVRRNKKVLRKKQGLRLNNELGSMQKIESIPICMSCYNHKAYQSIAHEHQVKCYHGEFECFSCSYLRSKRDIYAEKYTYLLAEALSQLKYNSCVNRCQQLHKHSIGHKFDIDLDRVSSDSAFQNRVLQEYAQCLVERIELQINDTVDLKNCSFGAEKVKGLIDLLTGYAGELQEVSDQISQKAYQQRINDTVPPRDEQAKVLSRLLQLKPSVKELHDGLQTIATNKQTLIFDELMRRKPTMEVLHRGLQLSQKQVEQILSKLKQNKGSAYCIGSSVTPRNGGAVDRSE